MKIINFLWHFGTGGIGKCFLTYDRLGEVESNLSVKSVCVIKDNAPCDIEPLVNQKIEVIHIRNNFDFGWMKRIRRLVMEFQPDFFFCHSSNGPIMLTLFNKRYGFNIPMINSCHGFQPGKSILGQLIGKIWLRLMNSYNIRKEICVENYTPRQLAELGVNPSKVVVVHNGIEDGNDFKKLDLSPYAAEGPIIITTSRLVRLKGLDYLLNALKIIKDKGIKFHYFCIGDGEEEVPLKVQCQNLGLEDVVTFVGYQSNISDWMETCDIFTLPSLLECHSIAILEAMRAKKAIVATNIGGNPESIQDVVDGLLVPAENADALAEALERVLTSKELREELGGNAHAQFLKRFTVDVMMKNLAKEIISTEL